MTTDDQAREAFEDAERCIKGINHGHEHWDRTMQHGAGCNTCAKQRESTNLAVKLFRAAIQAATAVERARADERVAKMPCYHEWMNGGPFQYKPGYVVPVCECPRCALDLTGGGDE